MIAEVDVVPLIILYLRWLLLNTKQGLVCALFHEQRCYLYLSQQEVGLPVEFLHLELGCRGRLASHRSDTNCCDLSPIKQQRNTS